MEAEKVEKIIAECIENSGLGSLGREDENIAYMLQSLLLKLRDRLVEKSTCCGLKTRELLSYEEVMQKLHDVYVRKNSDYGDSFSKSLNKYGEVAAMVRIEDKKNRLDSLFGKENDRMVVNEPLDDTIEDIANYFIMWRAWRQRQKTLETGGVECTCGKECVNGLIDKNE